MKQELYTLQSQEFQKFSDDIQKGEILSISYTQPLKCTNQRRKNLKDIKCFDCMCERCLDPTECGLYLNSMNCSNCKDGKVTIYIK